MARIRTIKPEFWTSEQVVECSPIARLLFVGMWNFCDDGGNHPASAKTLKMQIFPGDDIAASQIESYISELLSNGLLSEYTAEGRKYWHVTGWRHQKIDRPSYKHPRPFDERSPNDGRGLDDGHPPEGKGREGKGRESNIPPTPQGGDEDEIPAGWKADSRTMKPMSLDWTPDTDTLNTYLQGKAANGRPVTAADISARLDSWRENAHASGKTMTDAQWTLLLIKYVMTCLTNDNATPANRKASEPQADPLAFTEENRPKHGPYALFKPGPKKTPMTDEGRARVEQLRRQAFGDTA